MKGIAKFFKNLVTQLQVAYDPDLIPLYGGGIIIDWVDSRTGERPWFSCSEVFWRAAPR
jgi:hypothetical protein